MTVRVIKLPDIGEGVAEAEVVEWHVAVGDEVAEDQVLAAVMTDKATVEIPSPVTGKVVSLGGEVGSVLAVGQDLIGIDVAGSASGDQPAKPKEAAKAAAAPQTAQRQPSIPSPRPAPEATRPASPPPSARPHNPSPQGTATSSTATPKRPLASPAVRGRALEAGIDLRQVAGTGPAGRISHADLDNFARSGPAGGAARRAPRTGTEEIKVVGLRRRIAEKMAEASRRIAHFSYIEEVDVTALEDLRAHLNRQYGDARPKLTMLPFIVRAIVVALNDFPQMNAHYDDEKEIITRHFAAHVGIATQTPTGLTVPVLHNAEALSLWDSATEIHRLAQGARGASLGRDELTGSTITITSLGALGGIATTPVINHPEVAIIGVNRLAIRPLWENGQFVPRKMMNLSSSFDHRVVDGHDAAQFIQRIKGLLELPATLFIEE